MWRWIKGRGEKRRWTDGRSAKSRTNGMDVIDVDEETQFVRTDRRRDEERKEARGAQEHHSMSHPVSEVGKKLLISRLIKY